MEVTMKRRIVIFTMIAVVLFLIIPVSYADELAVEPVNQLVEPTTLELTKEGALSYAVENSLELEIKRLELLKAEISYKDDIRGIKKSEDNIEYFPIRDPLTGVAIPDGSINLVLIKNGAARRGVELAFNISKWNLTMTENKVKYNVEKAYFDLIQVEKELDIAGENLKLSEKQLEQGKLRYQVGLLSKQQLLGLEMAFSQAKSGFDAATMLYEIQKMSFRNTLGMALDKGIELTDKIQSREYSTIDLEALIKKALEENGGVRIYSENYEISKLTLQAVSARYPENTFRYREQAVETKKAEQSLLQIKSGVEMGVRSSYLSLITAEKQIATFELAVQQATEALRITELSFQLGQNTATDVTQANINLMNAKNSLAQQIHAFNLALLDFEYSTGIGK
jgi:outer membrane protein TolC